MGRSQPKLLTRAINQGTPLIDGDKAVFLWKGRRLPKLIGDFTEWEDGTPAEMSRIAPGVWTYELLVPSDAYIEYAFMDGIERFPDPFNSRKVLNGLEKANNFFYLPEGKPTPLADRRKGVSRGKLIRYVIEGSRLESMVGGKRVIYLYQPPTTEPFPLIVVMDGREYLRWVHLPNIVDNLIVEKHIRPIALAMVTSDGRSRNVEYACSEATIGFLINSVIPLSQENLNLVDIKALPGAYGLLGASMGGLMALYAALRFPQIFSHVHSQSGAFSSETFDYVVFDLIRFSNIQLPKMWIDVGQYDYQGLITANQRMHELLISKHCEVLYRQYHAGHNFSAWRDDVWRGLEYLYKRG